MVISKIKNCFIALVIAFSVQLEASMPDGGGETINSSQIIQQAVNWSCIAWEPIGVCLWMTCTIFGCDFDYSLKVKHNISDAVVSAYHNTGENPWTDIASYSQPTSFAEDGGTNSEGATVNSEQALRFKNVDVIGSPGNIFFEALSSSDYFCDPGATFFFPYMLSTLDPNWRDPTVETPWTLWNTFRGLRKGLTGTYFGPIYPRIGFVNQGHDYKASAVVAQRAADIVTRDYQPHIYWPMTYDSEDGWWPPEEVEEGEEDTHRWQQLLPTGNSSGCVIWPDIDDLADADDPYNERLNDDKGNAFHLWRPYRCCEREGAVLIFHTGD